ncbi:protein phosphatase 1 regulatory subunit 36-like isoform X1 [Plodia interpunctella]|uniref:protein phosphatase 1 regulatory subunit 36-like isoform X1 n=1 Tax=Plodia interpunctella TaxID=58824 RepID=UPI0023686D27|nr:protein phosphatase 1 regulatory subunit 36-like isoform X1 [Plodia interpunctella]
MADDDDEEGFGGAYEDGHWIWDENNEQLAFVSDLPPMAVEAIQIPTKAPTGTVEFRDDVDLIEQIRFRRRYQRKVKPGQAEIITVQDVKDIALFTAPVNIMSPVLINMLHLSTTDRFIRALILYCAYYLQIADEMTRRIMELETKVRTPVCELLENEYRDNLGDLRLLVSKEYSTMLIGGSDTRKFHHMGAQKKRRSLSDKDARLFETLLRMCVQIVWLALGRKSFNQIELEMNRMFKSEIFNSVEHTLKTNYITNMAKEERDVLLGHCVRKDTKLNTQSPLMNEVFCHRKIDYRILGLGVIKFPQMTPRLQYMYQAVAGDEESLSTMGVVLGIIGMPRSAFDTMLRPLPTAGVETGKSAKSVAGMSSGQSPKSSASVRKSMTTAHQLYPDIVLPNPPTKEIYFPPSFPEHPERARPCSETQRRRWQNRLQKLLHPQSAGR